MRRVTDMRTSRSYAQKMTDVSARLLLLGYAVTSMKEISAAGTDADVPG